MDVIKLPPYVFEKELVAFLTTIWKPLNGRTLEIDFSRVKYYIPLAITALLAHIDHAERDGRAVVISGLEQCEGVRYLQRIDFFNQLGIHLDEDFTRHAPGAAFVPLQEIELGPVTLRNDQIATELAQCVAGNQQNQQSDVFQLAEYSLGEVIANVKQHAEQRGFACAQYVAKRDMARIGIADSGIGISESFRRTGSPKYRPGMNDLQTLEVAMAAYGSSKAHLTTGPYGASANKGVGLTMVRFMVAESYGHFFLASGDAWWYRNGLAAPVSGVFPGGAFVQGTVVSAGFQREQVGNYLDLRKQAWNALGLTEGEDEGTLFT